MGLRREARSSKLNPGLTVCAITPFGLSGPNSGYLGDELTAVAAGGLSFATPGVPDGVADPANEPPLTANTPLAELMTGVLGLRSLRGRAAVPAVQRAGVRDRPVAPGGSGGGYALRAWPTPPTTSRRSGSCWDSP